MEHIAIDDVAMPATISPASVLKPVGRDLGTDHVAINYFELAPGDGLGFDYHRHLDQEEIFLPIEGVVTFETEDGPIEVAAGEAIRFAPGEFQAGRNRGDERVRVFALGGPADTTEIEYKRRCASCGVATLHGSSIDREAMVVVLTCTSCGQTSRQILE